jgi:hypothetical protein
MTLSAASFTLQYETIFRLDLSRGLIRDPTTSSGQLIERLQP